MWVERKTDPIEESQVADKIAYRRRPDLLAAANHRCRRPADLRHGLKGEVTLRGDLLAGAGPVDRVTVAADRLFVERVVDVPALGSGTSGKTVLESHTAATNQVAPQPESF